MKDLVPTGSAHVAHVEVVRAGFFFLAKLPTGNGLSILMPMTPGIFMARIMKAITCPITIVEPICLGTGSHQIKLSLGAQIKVTQMNIFVQQNSQIYITKEKSKGR